MWSPDRPNLYVARLTLAVGGRALDSIDVRFGFREFWIEGKRFMLNGIPITLRGESNYRFARNPESMDPEYGVEYNRGVMGIIKREMAANAFRVHASIAPGSVALAADEVGMMLINQSSIWSAMGNAYRLGGEEFMNNTRLEFEEWVRRDRNSPSVVIWDVENEMIRGSRVNMPWVMRLDGFILQHDDTRPIEHSGAGWYDAEQDIIHVHMHEHYSDVLDMWRRNGTRPIVFGEFWVGGRGETRLPTSYEFKSKDDWHAEEARVYEEYMLEMRYYGAGGVMPFRTTTGLFVNPPGGRSLFEFEPGKEPAYAIRAEADAEAIRHGLGPMTAFFWPRGASAQAGGEFVRELVVCNDSEEPRDLMLEWGLDGQPAKTKAIRLAPGEQHRESVALSMPAKPGALQARLLENGRLIARDRLDLRPMAPERLAPPKLMRRLVLYEGESKGSADALRELGLSVEVSDAVPASPDETIWIVAPKATDRRLAQ